MKVFIINGVPDRTEKVSKQFKDQNIDFILIQERGEFPEGKVTNNTPNNYDCTFKHWLAYKKAKEMNLDEFIVCEDDVWITEDFMKKLEKYKNAEFDVLYLNKEDFPRQQIKETDLIRYMDGSKTTVSYWIRKKARDVFLENEEMGLIWPTDHLHNRIAKMFGLSLGWLKEPLTSNLSIGGGMASHCNTINVNE